MLLAGSLVAPLPGNILGAIIPQAVTHSLMFLNMGQINARNVLSWLQLLTDCYFCI